MTPPTPPRRRWFSFRLRTLFVLLTILGIGLSWLAREAQIVQHRQATIRQIRATGGLVSLGGIDWVPGNRVKIRRTNPAYRISALRRFLGDRVVEFIAFNRQLTAADRQAMETIPKAEIYEGHIFRS